MSHQARHSAHPSGSGYLPSPRFWRRIVQSTLSRANITINGGQPWDMQVKNDRVFRRVALFGSVGLGESYMDNQWEVRQLDEFFSVFFAPAWIDSSLTFSSCCNA